MSDIPQRPEVSNSNLVTEVGQSVPLDSLSTEDFLRVLGLRVRSQRSAMSMSRKRLAEVSGVSERYLAQLESGQGNMSIALLRKVTSAIDLSLANLLSAETPELHDVAEPAVAKVAQESSFSSSARAYRTGNSCEDESSTLVTEL